MLKYQLQLQDIANEEDVGVMRGSGVLSEALYGICGWFARFL